MNSYLRITLLGCMMEKNSCCCIRTFLLYTQKIRVKLLDTMMCYLNLF